jgi:large subunit ribosomal protein L13
MQVIDGSEHIVGRLATYIAKQLLEGNEIIVVNTEKLVITGRKEQIFENYMHKRSRGKIRKGPYYPTVPDRMFRRIVRGMIPYQRPRGREAYKRLMTYIGVPKELQGVKTTKVEKALDKGSLKKVYLGDVSKMLGGF